MADLEGALRVVHCPVNTAGVPWANVEALRRRGVDAKLVVFNRYKLHPEADVSLERRGGLARRQATQWRALLGLLPRTDVFHFYFGLTLVPRSLQFPILRAFRKKSVMHYLGSDIRGKTPEELAFGKKAGAEVVGSYDALRWVPDAELIPPGIDVHAISPSPPGDRARPVILHAPSSRRRKGTEHVIAACEGLDADLVLVEGLHHAASIRALPRGRHRGGSAQRGLVRPPRDRMHGAREAGRVLSPRGGGARHGRGARRARTDRARDEGRSSRSQLEPLVASAAERRRVGAESRAYVERVHDLERVADRLLALYSRL